MANDSKQIVKRVQKGQSNMSEDRMQEADLAADHRVQTPGARKWAIAGIVCGILALLVPILFGPAGIILGIVGRSKGAGRIATIAIIVSIVVMIVGFIANAVVMSAMGGGA